MKLKFIGYWSKRDWRNPDGSPIYDGNHVYASNDGVEADAYFLLENGFSKPLGDNPEVPKDKEHLFKKEV